MRTPIDDPTDPRIAVFLGLRDQVARQKRELPGGDMASFFIAEGDLVIERAVRNGYRLRSVLISARRSKPLPPEADSSQVFEASDDVLTEITGRPALRDPLACFDRPEATDIDELLTHHRTFAVLENVNNPNNLGVIMRNAAGLGVDAVLLDPTCGDPLYRRAVRSSMGQVFTIPHARIDALPEGLDVLHRHNITTVALTPSGDTDLRGLDRPAKVAILLGAEGPGLTTATIAASSVRARIAMSRDIDSLNVANAAAIAFHHFAETSSNAEG